MRHVAARDYGSSMRKRKSAEPRIRRVVHVHGRVQGVFYRDTCRREATAHGVAGSAANLDDGSVEVVLEGPSDAVLEMVAWCRRGPLHAQVAEVELREEEPRGMSGFAIS